MTLDEVEKKIQTWIGWRDFFGDWPRKTWKTSRVSFHRDKPDVALRVAADIIKHFRVLEKFPRLGRVVPEFEEEVLREIIHSPLSVDL